LRDGIDQTNPIWLEDARLLESLGDAFGEAFWFEEAVKYYDRAITSGKSTAAIRAIERSANCRIRLAAQECENNPDGYIAAKRNIEKEIRKLKRLMSSIGETSERLSMIGSGYKRLAQISSGRAAKDCTSALKEMEKYYDLAWNRNEQVYPLAYPLANALTATIVQMLRASALDISKLPAIRKQIQDVEDLANKDQLYASDDFWAATGLTDVKLLLHLYDYMKGKKKVVGQKIHDDLVREYKTAWEQYGSARELNSIIEHYAFLAAIIKKSNAHEDLRSVLEKILASLKSTYEEAD
jgi:hypothetical protein